MAKQTKAESATGVERCRRKFLRYFKGGFGDATYLAWERDFKWEAHRRWERELGREELERLVTAKEFEEVARLAVGMEARTMLLFSFEKMALRDAVKDAEGAKQFALGLRELLHGDGTVEERFEAWCRVVEALPRRQTRVLTWPICTVFGFLAQPKTHFYLKPNVTKRAAVEYGYDFGYQSRPSGEAYARVLKFAAKVRSDLKELKPRDKIDIQGFLWVQGSDEYP